MELPCLEKLLSLVDSEEKLESFYYFFIRMLRDKNVSDRDMESYLEKLKLACADCSGLSFFQKYQYLTMSEIYLAVRPDEEPAELSCDKFFSSAFGEGFARFGTENNVCLVCPLKAPEQEKRVLTEYRLLATLLSTKEMFSRIRSLKADAFSTAENLSTCCNGIWPECFIQPLTGILYSGLLDADATFYSVYQENGVSALAGLVFEGLHNTFATAFGELPDFNRGAFEEYLTVKLKAELFSEEEFSSFCRQEKPKKVRKSRKIAKKEKEVFVYGEMVPLSDTTFPAATAQSGGTPVEEKEQALIKTPDGRADGPFPDTEVEITSVCDGALENCVPAGGNISQNTDEKAPDGEITAQPDTEPEVLLPEKEDYVCPLVLDIPFTRGGLLDREELGRETPVNERCFKTPFLLQESDMMHPFMEQEGLLVIPCLSTEKDILHQMLCGADRYREISLEAVYVRDMGYVLLFFGAMDSYAGYVRVTTSSGRLLPLDLDIKKMLTGKKVCKICYMPYLLTGLLEALKVRAEKIYSIYSAHVVIRRGSTADQKGGFHEPYEKVLSGYRGGILRERDLSYLDRVKEYFPQEYTIFCSMASYSLIRRRQENLVATLGLQKKLLRQQAIDLMLGCSFLRETLFPESGVSFTMGDTRPIWREFHLSPSYEPGYVLEFTFEAVSDKARARALRRGLLVHLSKLPTAFTKGLLKILYMNETCLMVYVHHAMRRHYDSHIAHFLTTRAYQLGIYEFTLTVRKWAVTASLVRFVTKAALEDKNDNTAEKVGPSEKQDGASAGKQKEKTGDETN